MKHDQPKHGDRRVRKGFLWFPKKLGGTIRWLERARWGQVWVRDIDDGGGWQSFCWLDEHDGVMPPADGYYYDIRTWTSGYNPPPIHPKFSDFAK